MNKKLIDFVFDPLEKAGYKVYFVGGCVRDYLLGKEPMDFDICTDATPKELHKIFHRFSAKTIKAELYGVTIPLLDKEEVEIATLRSDITKGRHPSVKFTKSIEEDAQRRDFTINSLYMDKNGKIYDPTGHGVDDVKRKEITFVGDAKDRLSEDPLRAFRYVRFISNGFVPAEDVEKIDIDFSDVSKERQLKEIKKIFAGSHFIDDITQSIMKNLGISKHIGMDEVIADMATCKQNPAWHSEGNVDAHTYLVMKAMANILDENKIIDEEKRFLLMLAAFLHDIGKAPAGRKNGLKKNGYPDVHDHDVVGAPLAKAFCKKLGMTNEEQDKIFDLVFYHMRMHELDKIKSNYKILKIVSKKAFNDFILLARADEAGCIKAVEDTYSGIDNVIKSEKVKHCIEIGRLPKQLITGDDLKKAGLKPNKTFKFRLETAHKLQVDRGITDKGRLLKEAIGCTIPKDFK